MLLGNNTLFHHRDHGRIAGEDRGRILSGDGDGDFLDIPGALVVTHGHIEGQFFFLPLCQRDDLVAAVIQMEGVFACIGINLQEAVVGLDAILHFDAFRIDPRQLVIRIMIQQAKGELRL